MADAQVMGDEVTILLDYFLQLCISILSQVHWRFNIPFGNWPYKLSILADPRYSRAAKLAVLQDRRIVCGLGACARLHPSPKPIVQPIVMMSLGRLRFFGTGVLRRISVLLRSGLWSEGARGFWSRSPNAKQNHSPSVIQTSTHNLGFSFPCRRVC